MKHVDMNVNTDMLNVKWWPHLVTFYHIQMLLLLCPTLRQAQQAGIAELLFLPQETDWEAMLQACKNRRLE